MSATLPLEGAKADASTGNTLTGEISTLKKGQIHYWCLQATREGQASYAHVHEIAQGLRRLGWEVMLFEPSYAVHRRPVGIVSKLSAFIALQFKIWFSAQSPDVIYARSHLALLPSFVWARLKRIPVVVEVNGTFEDYTLAYPWLRAFRSLVIWAARKCFQLSSAVIAVTPGLCDWVKMQVGDKPVFLVPNGANTSLFRPGAECQEPLSTPYVTFVGFFAPWQGVDVMLRAIAEPEWPSDVKLVIIGSGCDHSKVEKAATGNPNIVYLGRRPYRVVPGIIAGAIAGLSPQTNPDGRTSYGVYPLKVFEALSCGVPVIVTDFSGQRELIQGNDCGIVIPPDDPASLARSVAFLRQHPERAAEMGRRGREAVEKGFSWQHSAETTEIVINNVLRH